MTCEECDARPKWFVWVNMQECLYCDDHARGHWCDDGILHPIEDLDTTHRTER